MVRLLVAKCWPRRDGITAVLLVFDTGRRPDYGGRIRRKRADHLPQANLGVPWFLVQFAAPAVFHKSPANKGNRRQRQLARIA